jgi:hypothetical protein
MDTYNVACVKVTSNLVAKVIPAIWITYKITTLKMRTYRPLPVPDDSAWSRNKWLGYVPIFIKQFFQGLRNILRWMPTIYRDRHWDHSFLTDLIQKKLEFMRDELVTANRFVGVEAVNKDITLALNLLERIKHSYYELEMYEYIKKSYEFVPADATAEYYTMEQTILDDNLDEYFAKYKRTAKKLRKKYKLKRYETEKLAYRISDYNQQKCERIFWKLMHYKLNQWWD